MKGRRQGRRRIKEERKPDEKEETPVYRSILNLIMIRHQAPNEHYFITLNLFCEKKKTGKKTLNKTT